MSVGGGGGAVVSFRCPEVLSVQLIVVFRGHESMVTQVIKVTDFNSEVISNLRGHLEAAMASEAIKVAVRCNMHMNTRIIKVADFKSEFNFEPRGHLEAVMTSEYTKMAVRCNMHMETKVIEVADFIWRPVGQLA